MMTDPIADMLTRIRNANSIYRKEVDVPYSKIKEGIATKLKSAGFIKEYTRKENYPQDILTLQLKYGEDGEKVIRKIIRVSKPGRRVYHKVSEMHKILNGLGISLVSTSKGILTDRECHEQRIGGEVLCNVW